MGGFGKKLLSAALAVLAGLAFLEAISRMALPSRGGREGGAPPYDLFLGMLRPAGSSWEDSVYVGLAGREVPVPYSLSSLRLRGPEIAREKAPGSARVLCLGDSSTFGLGEEEPRTYPRVLEGLLRGPEGHRIEVLNAGVPGFSSVQGYLRLRDELLALAPDVVILSFGLNDASTTAVQMESDRRTRYSDAFLLRGRLALGGLERPSWFSGLGLVRALDLVSRKLRPVAAGEAPGSPRVTTLDFRRFVEMSADLARSKGARTLLLNIGAPPAYRMLLEGVAADRDLPYLDGDAEMRRRADEARTTSPYKEMLAELAAAWGVDWEKVESRDRLVVWDSVHPHRVGHRFLAEALADRVAPLLEAEE